MIFLVYSIIECIFVLSNTTIMANSKNNKRIKISKSLRISGSLRKFCSIKLIKRVGDIQADGQYKKAKNINVVKHTARAYWPIILN